MIRRHKALARALLAALALPLTAAAALIPASGRSDMVHDFKRDVIYVTAGNTVLRWHVGSESFLSPIVLGGTLRGIDISADARRIAVADQVAQGTDMVVHVVDLDTLAVSQLRAPLDFGEAGSYSVAFGIDGSLLVSTRYNGSGWNDLRRFDVATGAHQVILTSISQDAMIAASGDRTRAGFAEANISDGRWGRVDYLTGQVDHLTGYDRGTSWFNFEIGTNRTGTQFAIPTYGGTFFYNDALVKVATIGTYAGPQPIGVAYHPVENLAYFPWAQTSQVKIYETATFTEVGSRTFSSPFSTTGNFAYQQGRTKLSADGSLLMVTVNGAVEYQQLYAPLGAAAVSGSVTMDSPPVAIPLAGSIGNGGALSYALGRQAANGVVRVDGNVAWYQANAGFHGTDTFTYLARYGLAEVEATGTVTVVRPNQAPVAQSATVNGTEDQPIAITLQASDPEGQPLTYVIAPPANGTLTGTAPNLVFTPAPDFNGVAYLGFRVSDGQLESENALVTINVAAVNDPPVAQGASYTTAEDTAVAISTAWTDVDNPTGTTLTLLTVPQRGSLQRTGEMTWTYTPLPNVSGTDTFTFKVSDGQADSNVATVNIQVTPVNDAPVAANDSASVKKRRAVTIPVLWNDTDADGDALTVVSVSTPSQGSAAIQNNQIVYTAGTSPGTVAFQYTVSDGRGGTATATVTVQVTH